MRANEANAKKGSLSASFCTDKLLTLNSRLPSISQPSKVLIALKDKQRIFKEMNESLCEERLKSLNESRYEWESMAKRTTALRKKKKKGMGRPTKSLLEMLYNEELYEEPEDQDVFWKEIGGDFGPGTRTNASLTTVRDMAVILHGGETHTTLADTWIFSLGSLLWSPVYFIPRVLEPRSGHCSLVINHQVIVVGGETSHHSLPRIRQLLPSILSLNMDESVSGELHTLNPYIGMRKFHCAVDSGRHIFIHGGYGEKNELLDDPAELNLAFLRWKSVRATGSGPGPRAYHAAVTVPWNGKNAANEGGIYVFGGLDDRHVARDTMHVLRFSTHGSTWSSPATTGEAPAARYQHTMTCFPDLSLLVVYGGRQDAHSSSGYRCFGELHILHLSRLKWTKAVFRGSPPENRCGHLATAVGSKLVIFGGIHNSHFCSGSIFLAEMDKESSVRLIADDERRKDLLNRVEQFKLRSRLQKGTVRGTRKHVYFSLNSSPLCSPIPDLLTMLYQKVHSTNGEENSRKGVLE